jgi:formylglycine-generating enzyme required for sulfatase activity
VVRNDLSMVVSELPEDLATGTIIEIGRPYYLASHETTDAIFGDFLDDPDYPESEKPIGWRHPGTPDRTTWLSTAVRRQLLGARTMVETGPCPIYLISWYDAVTFCNWLSRKEGLSVCYERSSSTIKQGDQVYPIWQLTPDSDGYRLPTEDEWEFACRAGSTTQFCCGDDEAYLSGYAVYNSRHPEACAKRLPNAWGFFDMHGNIWEWCNDICKEGRHRPVRGGSYANQAAYQRSASRIEMSPLLGQKVGFRVARDCR